MIYPQSHHDGWDFGVGIRERGHVGRRHVAHTLYVLDIVDEVAPGIRLTGANFS